MKNVLLIFFFLVITFSCQNKYNTDSINDETNDSITWNVSIDQITGNNVKYPIIDSVSFIPITEYKINISDNHRVFLLNINKNNYVFLYGDLGYLETINFSLDLNNYAITHCPITNSTLVFKIGKNETLVPSGYRYNDNLIYLNTKTKVLNSQMLEKPIGYYNNSTETEANTTSFPILDSKWKTIYETFENIYIAKIKDLDLGELNETRIYDTPNDTQWDYFSVGINNNKIKQSIEIFNLDKINSERFKYTNDNLKIMGIRSKQLVRAFSTNLDLSFDANNKLLIDANDNKYDWNGYPIESLNTPPINIYNSYVGSTFAFHQLFDIVKPLN